MLLTKNLGDEPGIPELQSLYYDDYNFTDGKYIGVTDEGMEVYMKDLEILYSILQEENLSLINLVLLVENMPDEE